MTLIQNILTVETLAGCHPHFEQLNLQNCTELRVLQNSAESGKCLQNFCRKSMCVSYRKWYFRMNWASAPLGMDSWCRNVWKIQESKKKTHSTHLEVRLPFSRQHALPELRFCRILQNSAESAGFCRILQSSAERQNHQKSRFLQE